MIVQLARGVNLRLQDEAVAVNVWRPPVSQCTLARGQLEVRST
jgi:hypothetical protein